MEYNIKPMYDTVILEEPKVLKEVVNKILSNPIELNPATVKEMKTDAMLKWSKSSGLFKVLAVGPTAEEAGVKVGDKVYMDMLPTPFVFSHNGVEQTFYKTKAYNIDAVVDGVIEVDTPLEATIQKKSNIILPNS